MTDNIVTGAKLISAERKRQYKEEGFLQSKDQVYKKQELIAAAGCYLSAEDDKSPLPLKWPWAAKWWKPRSRIRNLVKAGALIAAEIDRLLYLEAQKDV